MAREFVYGIQPVLQVLESRKRPAFKLYLHRIHLSKEMKQLIRSAERSRISIQETDRQKLFTLSKTTHNQGVVLETEGYPYGEFQEILNNSKQLDHSLVLVLDQVQDPQNLGAILRSAHCAGVQGVILPEKGSAGVTTTVLKASAGAAEHLFVCRVKNLSKALKDLKEASYWIYGGEAGENPPYFDQRFHEKTVIVLGGEGGGMSNLVRKNCDFLISIPLLGKISSLNVSVAAGILLFEVLRQRKFSEKSP